MVRAILAGAKAQTRRVMSEPYHVNLTEGVLRLFNRSGKNWVESIGPVKYPKSSPYGQPGDRLYVRESARVDWVKSGLRTAGITYQADGTQATVEYPSRLAPAPVGKLLANGTYREASRIAMEIVSLRVERLQDISPRDCAAEGCKTFSDRGDLIDQGLESEGRWLRNQYRALWESINGPGSWDANPWVWVIEFKRVN
jgi:hypothetical protein